MSTFYCPLCASSVDGKLTDCPRCHADLSQYRNAYFAADALYNQALDFMEGERYDNACEKLCCAAFLRGEDEGIFRLWAQALELSGNIMGALSVTADLLAFCDTPDIVAQMKRLEQALNEKS